MRATAWVAAMGRVAMTVPAGRMV